MINSICVQCGSSTKIADIYLSSAYYLGKVLAESEIKLVYGGSNIGLMGAVARGAMENGGYVTGIITKDLLDKVEMLEVTELITVSSMHERKQLMSNLSDAFIALPGGYGTYEEFLEVVTWNQLKIITKPCGLLNINGFYNLFMDFINHSINEGFIHPVHRDLIINENDPEVLIAKLNNYAPILIDKWW